MKEDTHYITYHNIVEKGYDTEFETSYDNNEDKHKFSYPYSHIGQNSKLFPYYQVNEADETSAGDSILRNLHLSSGSQKLKRFNEESDYPLHLTVYNEELQNEKSSEKMLSTTLTSSSSHEENIPEIDTYTGILSTITFIFQKLYIILSSCFRDIQQSSFGVIVDMLTLVIFIVLLKRWLQFDVFGNNKGTTSELMSDDEGSHHKLRYRRKKRIKQTFKLEFEAQRQSCQMFSDTSPISRSSKSSTRSTSQVSKEKFSSSYISRSSVFDDSSINSDVLEISISDDISSVVTSSFSSNDMHDDTDCEASELVEDETYLTCNDNDMQTPCKLRKLESFLPNKEKPYLSQNHITSSPHLEYLSEKVYLSEKSGNESIVNNEEIDLLNSNSGIDDDENDESSECSWFTEYYPKSKQSLTVPQQYLIQKAGRTRSLMCI